MKQIILLSFFIVIIGYIGYPGAASAQTCNSSQLECNLCGSSWCSVTATCYTNSCNPCSPDYISCANQQGCVTSGYQKWCGTDGMVQSIPPMTFEADLGEGYRNISTGETVKILGSDIGDSPEAIKVNNWAPLDVAIWNPTTSFDLSSIDPWHEITAGFFRVKNLPGGLGGYKVVKEYRRLSDNFLIAKWESTYSDPLGYSYIQSAPVVGYVPCEIISNGDYSLTLSLTRGGSELFSKTIPFSVSGVQNPFSASLFPFSLPSNAFVNQLFGVDMIACGNNKPQWDKNTIFTTGQNNGVHELQYYRKNASGVWEKKDDCVCYKGAASLGYNECSGVYVSVCTNTWQISESTPGAYLYGGLVFDRKNLKAGDGHPTDPGSAVIAIGATTLSFDSTPFSPTNVKRGEEITVRGLLKDSAGKGIGGKTVALQCWNGSSWPQVAAGTTEAVNPESIGYTSFSWVPTTSWSGNVSCRLHFAGDSSYLASTSVQEAISIIEEQTLTYPSNTWQRLWYTTSGSSPSVSFGTFKGEGAGDDDRFGNPPNVASAAFTTDWGSNNVAFSTPNTIGFKSSRTINFPAGDLYRFTIGSDDGARLYIDSVNDGDTPKINMWSNDGYRTQSADVNLSAGDHRFRLDFYENTGDAKVSFNYQALPTAPAPSGVNTDPSDTAIYVSWDSIADVSNATYRLEWCKKSVIDAGGSFSSAACGPPNSPASGPPYLLTTLVTSGYIIGTEPATAYNLRVRVDSGTSSSYVFPGNWVSVSATTRTPISCNNVDPTNTASGSNVANDCFQDERRCGPLDVQAGCAAACFFGDNYLSTGLNPITKIGTIAKGKWTVTGTASYDFFAQGHGVECLGYDWRSSIHDVKAFLYLKYPSPIDIASSAQILNWNVTGEGGQEFSLPSTATLTFNKVFDCPDASCDLWFYSAFTGNTRTHRQVFPGGSGDYVRQIAVMSNNLSWTKIDGTSPGIPIIHTLQDRWRKENPVTNMTATDDSAVGEIGYAIKGKDCNYSSVPADPCSEADWKKAQKSDLSGDLALSGTSVTTDWKMSNADWGRLDESLNTLYLRVKDAAGNCTGCDGSITFGIKKDTVAPISKITEVNTYDAVADAYKNPGVRLNYPDVGYSSAFLNADNEGDAKKTWWMYVANTDTGSALNVCSIAINGVAKSNRSCAAGWVTFTVGKRSTRADCRLEGDDTCTVKVWARDNAGNITATKNVNSITPEEKDYLNGLVTQDANEFTFSVDWKKPTAH